MNNVTDNDNKTYQKLEFTGTAKEYFGIWIVNILLTILTLGIYSAWAKVRRRQFFQGHTLLNSTGFGYHARGMQIFIGRIIALGLFLLIPVTQFIHPVLFLLVYLLIIILLPMFMHRSLRFNARVTSYRNVRFNFVGTISGAYKAFLLGPIVSSVTLGLMIPVADYWRNEYIGNNMRYGNRPFITDINLSKIYRAWIIPVMITVIFIVLFFMMAFFSYNLHMEFFSSFFLLIAYASVFIAWTSYAICVRNIAWSMTRFDGKHPIQSTIHPIRYVWILFSNAIVTICTLGLMRPWCSIRTARYIWTNTAIMFTEPLGEIVSSIEESSTPVAAEYLDLEGFDFGF